MENKRIAKVLCGYCNNSNRADCPEGRVWCGYFNRYMDFDGFCSLGKGKMPAPVQTETKSTHITDETMAALKRMGEKVHGGNDG